MTRTPNSSLTNALHILKSFSIDEQELTLSDITERIGVSKSTACRLVQTLESEGFINQNTGFNTYSLGSSILALSNTVVDQVAILKETTHFLKKLSMQTKESAHIAILENTDVIYLKKEDSQYRVQLRSHIGRRNPAHCTASGLAILAQLNPHTVDMLYPEKLTRYTQYSLATLEQLQQQLSIFRKQGYAVTRGHFIETIIAIGAPIYNKQHIAFASVSVAGPIKRILPNMDKIIEHVMTTSKQITQFIQTHEKEIDLETFIK